MGTKHLRAISDYHRNHFNLRVDCRACGHVALLDPLPIVLLCQERGWSRQMASVQARLRCKACGAKDVFCGPAF